MMTQTTNLRLNMFEASDKFSNDALNENWQKIDDGLTLIGSDEGTNIQITDAANNCGLYSLYIEGKSVQNGTPTPDAQIEIDSIGDSGTFAVTTNNGGETSTTATITSALPLCSVGDVKDELIFNADGTAKIFKSTYIKVFDGTENISIEAISSSSSGVFRYSYGDAKFFPCNNSEVYAGYCSHYTKTDANTGYTGTVPNSTAMQTASISFYVSQPTKEEFKAFLAQQYANGTPVTIVVRAKVSEEISLTADETTALLRLETFEGLTNVFNSDNAEMVVKYWRNEAVGSLLTSISRSTNSRLTALENAILGG